MYDAIEGDLYIYDVFVCLLEQASPWALQVLKAMGSSMMNFEVARVGFFGGIKRAMAFLFDFRVVYIHG